jgi:hypothetical protein
MASNPQALPVFIGLPTPGPLANYVSLICSNWRGAPKYLQWLTANLQIFQDGIACMNQFDVAFGLLTAVGPQLDVLGNVLGQSRTVGFQPRFGISPTLDDTTYRLLLRATVYRNHWSGLTVDIWPGWYNLFPGSKLLIQDSQAMSVSFLIWLSASTIVLDLIINGLIIPRPQGVQYSYTIQQETWNSSEWNTFSWAGPPGA